MPSLHLTAIHNASPSPYPAAQYNQYLSYTLPRHIIPRFTITAEHVAIPELNFNSPRCAKTKLHFALIHNTIQNHCDTLLYLTLPLPDVTSPDYTFTEDYMAPPYQHATPLYHTGTLHDPTLLHHTGTQPCFTGLHRTVTLLRWSTLYHYIASLSSTSPNHHTILLYCTAPYQHVA